MARLCQCDLIATGITEGVEFLAISRTSPLFPRPAGKAVFAISRPNVRGKMKRFALTTLSNQIRLQIAENSTESLNFLTLLRWALVIIFL